MISCTEKMNIDLKSTDPILTVEGSVTSDLKNHKVILKESSDVYNKDQSNRISNAVVTVSDGTKIFSYSEVQPGYYESDLKFAGQPGKTYTLSIDNVDINKDGKTEKYKASSYMRDPYVIDKIKLHFDPDYEAKDDEEGEFWLVKLFLQDNPKTKDYYAFACRKNNILVHDTITEIIVQKDTYFNGSQTKGVNVGELNQSKSDEILKDKDVITLETYAIGKDYYYFIDQFQKMSEDRSMFSGPPGNIKTNISNGGIGFFSAYSITRTSIVYNKK